MTQRHGDNYSGTRDTSTQLSFAGMVPEQTLLPNSALQLALAPNGFSDHACGSNGCVSEISSDAIHGYEHDYAAAMKSYAVVYEEYQSYLLPAGQAPKHDYDLAAKPVPAFSHLGCLNEDLLESTVQNDAVSDDDIEGCGYMAWLHH